MVNMSFDLKPEPTFLGDATLVVGLTLLLLSSMGIGATMFFLVQELVR